MRIRLAVLGAILAGCIPAPGTVKVGTVSTKYDRFSKGSTVVMDGMTVQGPRGEVKIFAIKSTADQFIVGFTLATGDPRIVCGSPPQILIDGEAAKIVDADRKLLNVFVSPTTGASYFMSVSANIANSDLERLASATEFDARICLEEIGIRGAYAMQSLREFAAAPVPGVRSVAVPTAPASQPTSQPAH